VEQAAGDPVADEIERPLRRPFDVERHAERPRIGDIVAQRQRAIELGLADVSE
jgi:hypothetical protein